MKVQVLRVSPEAKLPSFAHDDDAGMDLYAYEACTIEPGMRCQAQTGIALAIPEGYVGLVWDKSGISHKNGIKTLGGVIDSGYRGEILVGLVNLGEHPYIIEKGAKIAQMLIQSVEHPELEVVETLEGTTRGSGGFGSTGV